MQGVPKLTIYFNEIVLFFKNPGTILCLLLNHDIKQIHL